MRHRSVADDRGSIFMNSTLVAAIKKNNLEEIRISLLKNNKIDLRTCFYFPNDTEPRQTKKGICLSLKHLPSLVDALEKYAGNPGEPVQLEFDQSDREKVRAYSTEYMGSRVVHIRTFYVKDSEVSPGKGISFPSPLLQKMIDGLKCLDARRAKMGTV